MQSSNNICSLNHIIRLGSFERVGKVRFKIISIVMVSK